MSNPILKIIAFPVSVLMMCLGILTILGGHITPGGGFQGGAMIAGAFIFCLIVYGLKDNPFDFSHEFISSMESIGALGFVLLGLVGLFVSGSFLYNVGADIYGLVPAYISNIFSYPDPTNAGIVPYLNILVGIKVLVGLSAVPITFMKISGSYKDIITEHDGEDAFNLEGRDCDEVQCTDLELSQFESEKIESEYYRNTLEDTIIKGDKK